MLTLAQIIGIAAGVFLGLSFYGLVDTAVGFAIQRICSRE